MKKFLASLVGAAMLVVPAAEASASEDNPVRLCRIGIREVGVIVDFYHPTTGEIWVYGCIFI